MVIPPIVSLFVFRSDRETPCRFTYSAHAFSNLLFLIHFLFKFVGIPQSLTPLISIDSHSLEHALSHGTGAVNGVVEYARKRRAFCLVVDFMGKKFSR